MEHELILEVVLFFGLFLTFISLLQYISQKTAFPYTAALLLAGLFGQVISHFSSSGEHLRLTPDLIFYILLPILLFESALHINIHQFRLQFKTVSFLATFGLLLSVFIISVAGPILLGVPFEIALLFGALISATDPIAIRSLYKTLGAPKRLALVAVGESMFNNATGVIAFRIVSGFVFAREGFDHLSIISVGLNFSYVFFGSIIFGAIAAFLATRLFSLIKNDRFIINTASAALAIGGFVASEYFFKLSGVITTVMAGIVLANFGKTKISHTVMHFIKELWTFLSIVALSLVFFFATYNLDLQVLTRNIFPMIMAILLVLVARAISVYVTSYLSNKLSFFSDEPNIPSSWQHVLNWGGLRGVIPLVLVYSLPDNFTFKEDVLTYTLAVLLFTLFVNGTTVRKFLIYFKLHIPKKEEEITSEELKIIDLEEKRRNLHSFIHDELDEVVIEEFENQILHEEKIHKENLLELASAEEFYKSLKLQSLAVERSVLATLFHNGYIKEDVFTQFETELDLQQDALEYDELFKARGIDEGGLVHASTSYRVRLRNLRNIIRNFPYISDFIGFSEDDLILERYSLLKTRVVTNLEAIRFLDHVEQFTVRKNDLQSIKKVKKYRKTLIDKNKDEIGEIIDDNPELVKKYQRRLVKDLIINNPY